MSQTKHQIQAILSEWDAEPRQQFGQNFMIVRNLVRIVADAAGICPGDCVLEVGPGTGTLSEEILARGARLVAVEIDARLAEGLRTRFGSNDQFILIEGDALAGKHHLNPQILEQHPVRLAANLPYNIASPLMIELLCAGVQTLAFTVQREVADRLRSASGIKAYGPLSVMAQALSRVEVLRTLPPEAFWPRPKVESALVRMTRQDRLGERANQFSQFVHLLFSARRKMLRKALAQAKCPDVESALTSAGVDGQLRPDQLEVEQLLALFAASGWTQPITPGRRTRTT